MTSQPQNYGLALWFSPVLEATLGDWVTGNRNTWRDYLSDPIEKPSGSELLKKTTILQYEMCKTPPATVPIIPPPLVL